jgi:hypothetical protein
MYMSQFGSYIVGAEMKKGTQFIQQLSARLEGASEAIDQALKQNMVPRYAQFIHSLAPTT